MKIGGGDVDCYGEFNAGFGSEKQWNKKQEPGACGCIMGSCFYCIVEGEGGVQNSRR